MYIKGLVALCHFFVIFVSFFFHTFIQYQSNNFSCGHVSSLKRDSVTGFLTSSFLHSPGQWLSHTGHFNFFQEFSKIVVAQGAPKSTLPLANRKIVWRECYFIFCFDTIGQKFCWAGGGLSALILFTTESDLHFHIQNFKL